MKVTVFLVPPSPTPRAGSPLVEGKLDIPPPAPRFVSRPPSYPRRSRVQRASAFSNAAIPGRRAGRTYIGPTYSISIRQDSDRSSTTYGNLLSARIIRQLLKTVVEIVGRHLALQRQHMEQLQDAECAAGAWFVVCRWIPLPSQELLTPTPRCSFMAATIASCDVMDSVGMKNGEIHGQGVRSFTG